MAPSEAPATPGLEWLLLCDGPVSDFAQALACARQCARRWLIEDFHKTPKTGLRVEQLPLQTAARPFAALALLSVVALALAGPARKKSARTGLARHLGRPDPERPRASCGCYATKVAAPCTPCARRTWPWPRWAGTWAGKGTGRRAGRRSGTGAPRCGGWFKGVGMAAQLPDE